MDEREEEIVPSNTSEDDDDDTLDIGENKVEPPKKRKRRKVGELSGCQMALKRLKEKKEYGNISNSKTVFSFFILDSDFHFKYFLEIVCIKITL